MIARTSLVGKISGNGLNLTHELIAYESIVSVKV